MNARLDELLEKLNEVAGDPDGPLHDPDMAELVKLVRDMAPKDTLTQKEYVASNGLKCPACHNTHCVSVDRLEIDGDSAWGPANCTKCHATWNEIYRLEGFDSLERPT